VEPALPNWFVLPNVGAAAVVVVVLPLGFANNEDDIPAPLPKVEVCPNAGVAPAPLVEPALPNWFVLPNVGAAAVVVVVLPLGFPNNEEVVP